MGFMGHGEYSFDHWGYLLYPHNNALRDPSEILEYPKEGIGITYMCSVSVFIDPLILRI